MNKFRKRFCDVFIGYQCIVETDVRANTTKCILSNGHSFEWMDIDTASTIGLSVEQLDCLYLGIFITLKKIGMR